MKLHISLKEKKYVLYKKDRGDTKKSWYQQRPSFPWRKQKLQFVVYELVSNFTCISEIGKAQEPKSH